MNIAIVGYGVVGKGVDILLRNTDITVSKLFVRTSRLHEDSRMCDNYQDIVTDSSIDVVVETLGGIEPAHSFIIQAMQHGKSVVSANKAVIALYFEEFQRIATENNVHFLFEASVGGTLPILKTIYDTIEIDTISKVGGILNGTSNYILSQMATQPLSFQMALKQAQEAGYAESDPTDDIEGLDIRNKIMIAASLAFQTIVPLEKIQVQGISQINKLDFSKFAEFNLSCKLFAMAQRKDNTYSITVEPTLFSSSSLMGSVIANYNLAMIETASSGPISIIGQGAGQLPTAHSVVSDLRYIEKQLPIRHFKKLNTISHFDDKAESLYYLRTKLSRDDFPTNIQANIIYQSDEQYFIGKITHSDLYRLQEVDSALFFARCDESVWDMIKKEVIA